jgi:hypothetical protein
LRGRPSQDQETRLTPATVGPKSTWAGRAAVAVRGSRLKTSTARAGVRSTTLLNRPLWKGLSCGSNGQAAGRIVETPRNSRPSAILRFQGSSCRDHGQRPVDPSGRAVRAGRSNSHAQIPVICDIKEVCETSHSTQIARILCLAASLAASLLGESLDRSASTPPTGATSCRRPPRGGLPNTTASGRGCLLFLGWSERGTSALDSSVRAESGLVRTWRTST